MKTMNKVIAAYISSKRSSHVEANPCEWDVKTKQGDQCDGLLDLCDVWKGVNYLAEWSGCCQQLYPTNHRRWWCCP